MTEGRPPLVKKESSSGGDPTIGLGFEFQQQQQQQHRAADAAWPEGAAPVAPAGAGRHRSSPRRPQNLPQASPSTSASHSGRSSSPPWLSPTSISPFSAPGVSPATPATGGFPASGFPPSKSYPWPSADDSIAQSQWGPPAASTSSNQSPSKRSRPAAAKQAPVEQDVSDEDDQDDEEADETMEMEDVKPAKKHENEAERQERRTIQNRKAQKEFRQRKKAHLKELEVKVADYERNLRRLNAELSTTRDERDYFKSIVEQGSNAAPWLPAHETRDPPSRQRSISSSSQPYGHPAPSPLMPHDPLGSPQLPPASPSSGKTPRGSHTAQRYSILPRSRMHSDGASQPGSPVLMRSVRASERPGPYDGSPTSRRFGGNNPLAQSVGGMPRTSYHSSSSIPSELDEHEPPSPWSASQTTFSSSSAASMPSTPYYSPITPGSQHWPSSSEQGSPTRQMMPPTPYYSQQPVTQVQMVPTHTSVGGGPSVLAKQEEGYPAGVDSTPVARPHGGGHQRTQSDSLISFAGANIHTSNHWHVNVNVPHGSDGPPPPPQAGPSRDLQQYKYQLRHPSEYASGPPSRVQLAPIPPHSPLLAAQGGNPGAILASPTTDVAHSMSAVSLASSVGPSSSSSVPSQQYSNARYLLHPSSRSGYTPPPSQSLGAPFQLMRPPSGGALRSSSRNSNSTSPLLHPLAHGQQQQPEYHRLSHSPQEQHVDPQQQQQQMVYYSSDPSAAPQQEQYPPSADDGQPPQQW